MSFCYHKKRKKETKEKQSSILKNETLDGGTKWVWIQASRLADWID